MKTLDTIAEELFNKIRGRFPSVTIGDETGTLSNVPKDARYFDFTFTNEDADLGKVSISLDENDGVVIVVGRDIVEYQTEDVQDRWFNFLKELRIFAKKRMMPFDVRDINKSNLNKRDYKFLAANRLGEETMAESKMYGTNKTSYQKIGNARLAIKHTQPINIESATGRTQKIGNIYIESPEGERFKYPFKHLSGARAMARHIAEGGNAYDEFGKYISGLSEELGKLRKFNTYMNRSGVMAETLGEYTDIVKERAMTIRKEIQNLQKESYYKETVEGFSAPIVEDVPDDIAENWIDQLTIKQFNEDLKDVFPYIYKLVGEATRAKELGPDELDEVAGPDKCWDGYKKAGTQPGTGKNKGKRVNNCVPEEIELEQGFEEMMGQFGEAVVDGEITKDSVKKSALELLVDIAKTSKQYKGEVTDDQVRYLGSLVQDFDMAGIETEKYSEIEKLFRTASKTNKADMSMIQPAYAQAKELDEDADNIYNDPGMDWMQKHEPYIDYHIDAANNALKAGNMEEREKHRELARAHRKAQMKWEENRNDGSAETVSRKVMQASKEMGADIDEGNAFANAVRQAKMSGKKKGDKIDGPDGDEITLEKDEKTPLGEFILSYFDRHSGQFPKGETAILTMVEKDYGEEFIEPAKAFIEQVNNLVAERFGFREPAVQEDEYEMSDISRLAGLR